MRVVVAWLLPQGGEQREQRENKTGERVGHGGRACSGVPRWDRDQGRTGDRGYGDRLPSAEMGRQHRVRVGGIQSSRAEGFYLALTGMAGVTENLEVGWVPRISTSVDGCDVVDHLGRVTTPTGRGRLEELPSEVEPTWGSIEVLTTGNLWVHVSPVSGIVGMG